MLTFSAHLTILLSIKPIDMRKAIGAPGKAWHL